MDERVKTVGAGEPITRRRFLRTAALAGAGLAAWALGACASEEQAASPTPQAGTTPGAAGIDLAELEQAAKREGVVNVYSSASTDLITSLNQAFERKYGIRTNLQRAASGPLTQRFAAEAESGNVVADVLQTSDVVFYDDAIAKGWIAKVDGLPALQSWPQQYWNGYYALSTIGIVTIGYNTNKVRRGEVTGWQDVINPKWRGQILFVDPRNVAVWVAVLYLLDKTYGDDFLRALGRQDLRLVESAVPAAQQLAAGEAALSFPGAHWDKVQLKQSGAPVDDVVPNPTTGIEQLMGITAKAPHPNAAKLFLNFMLSQEGQQALVQAHGVSVLPNIPGAQPLPQGYVRPEVKEAMQQRDRLIGLLGLR